MLKWQNYYLIITEYLTCSHLILRFFEKQKLFYIIKVIDNHYIVGQNIRHTYYHLNILQWHRVTQSSVERPLCFATQAKKWTNAVNFIHTLNPNRAFEGMWMKGKNWNPFQQLLPYLLHRWWRGQSCSRCWTAALWWPWQRTRTWC